MNRSFDSDLKSLNDAKALSLYDSVEYYNQQTLRPVVSIHLVV